MQINLTRGGTAEQVIAFLKEEGQTDGAEKEIRQAIADHIERACAPDDTVSVSVSITCTY